ncbi:hypothetical protein F8M41_009934 [Gigaspora margarita]|uniref:Uncharacterized protein n=1 Tax=Gigaspora margarita TaxID=4874 RepID=A0A8H3X3C9_GIGMA|nr:hypothetical protein F8M41_009934 [Gigaspora margarita]
MIKAMVTRDGRVLSRVGELLLWLPANSGPSLCVSSGLLIPEEEKTWARKNEATEESNQKERQQKDVKIKERHEKNVKQKKGCERTCKKEKGLRKYKNTLNGSFWYLEFTVISYSL